MYPESTIHVAVVPPPEAAGELTGRDLIDRLEDRVRELGASLGTIANELRAELDNTLARDVGDEGWKLDEVQLSFSLDLEAEAGVIVARAATTAGFRATLHWSRAVPDATAGGR